LKEEWSFYKFVGENFRARKEGLKGKVYITFIVEKDGSIDVKSLRDIGYGTEKKL
jgi:protein TonB